MKAPWNFARFLPLAERLLSRGRLPALIFAVARKGPSLGKLKDDVRLLQALCVAWWRGEYRAISSRALLTIVAGLLYFVSPLDAIPDWLPGIGLLDELGLPPAGAGIDQDVAAGGVVVPNRDTGRRATIGGGDGQHGHMPVGEKLLTLGLGKGFRHMGSNSAGRFAIPLTLRRCLPRRRPECP